MYRKAMTWIAAACVTLSGTTALAQNDRKAAEDDLTRYWYSQTTPRATPAPAPAQPAAAPAPRRTGYSSTGAFTIHNNEGRVHSAYPTGEASGGALHVEKLLPAEIAVGEQFRYVIVATSLIDGEIHNVNICDQLSNNFQVVSSTPNAGSTAGNRYCWNLGNFGPREQKVIEITATASGGDMLNTCAEVEFDLPLCAQARIVQPALTLEMNAPQQICKCDPLPISYVVCNPGTGVARDVVVSQQLPQGLTVNGSNTVSFNIPQLNPGECREFQVTAQASGPGTFRHNATARSGGGLTADASAGSTQIGEARLAMNCDSPNRRFIGRSFTHEFTVSNPGNCPAENVVLTAALNGGQAISASDGGQLGGSQVTWNLGTIPANGSRTVSINLNPSQPTTITTRANVNGACVDPATTECSTLVEGIPAVLLEVVDENDPVQVGEDEVYTITVTNQGSATDTNITIVCELENAVSFVSAAGATPGTHANGRVTFQPLASLPPKARASWQVRVRGVSSADSRFRVRMDTDQLTRPSEETEATNIYE